MSAYGTLLLDDGISRSELENQDFEYYSFNHTGGRLVFSLASGRAATQANIIDKVIILNAEDLATVAFACYVNADNRFVDMHYIYDEGTKTLIMRPKSPT